jgi:hypothetical protein
MHGDSAPMYPTYYQMLCEVKVTFDYEKDNELRVQGKFEWGCIPLEQDPVVSSCHGINIFLIP